MAGLLVPSRVPISGNASSLDDADGNLNIKVATPNGTLEPLLTLAGNTGNFAIGAAWKIQAQGFGLPPYLSSNSDVTFRSTGSGTLDINFPTSATANSGAVSPPAGATGFVTMKINGTAAKVPYYPV